MCSDVQTRVGEGVLVLEFNFFGVQFFVTLKKKYLGNGNFNTLNIWCLFFMTYVNYVIVTTYYGQWTE